VLTIANYKNEEQVEKYFEEHLGTGEYHSEKGDSAGTWHGKTGEYLGLEEGSEVKLEDFKKMVQGINPGTGKRYLIRKKSNRIVAREMLFSAPKTVSILAVTLGDQRLKDAHLRAVDSAFKELESLAESKVRRGFWINADGKRATGNVIAARFTHKTSRALDPQLHSHNVVFNVTYDPVEKRLKALDPNEIFNSTSYLSEVYRAALAREVMDLGYEIEMGKYTFRIKGVSPEIEARFSKRSQQIEKAALKLLDSKGVKVDKRGRALLAELTRRSKDHDITEFDYLKLQQDQLTKDELENLESLVKNAESKAKEVTSLSPDEQKELARSSIQYAFKHIFERASVVNEQDLIKAVLRKGKGKLLLADVKEELKNKRYIRRGKSIMTREERDREVRILALVREGKRKFSPFIANESPIIEQLGDDQKKAVRGVGASLDQYVFIRGVAGSGKTFAISAIKESMPGEKMVFLAPTGSAADTLRQEGFEGAKTLQYFLSNKIFREKTKNGTIVLDEAGLISTRQMDLFLRITRKNNTRVIFVGDSGQHNSVEGGDALRLIEDYSVIQKFSLSKVRRQKDSKYNEAVQRLSEGQVLKGLSILEEMGAIHELPDEKRFEAVAADYVSGVKENIDTLIVSPTNLEIEQINATVRAKLKEDGLIQDQDTKIKVYKSTNLTTAEKSYSGNYEVGQILSVHKDKRKFKQGDILRVKEVKGFDLVTVNQDGKELTVTPRLHKKLFDVVREDEKGFTVGDKVIVKANYATSPENKVLNGTIAKIDAIEKDGSIKLSNGKVLGPQFKQFDHGYAITSQASQGKTAWKVIICAGSQSGMALCKNLLYVSCSRGRATISVYTDNLKEFAKNAQRSSGRKLVTEEMVRDKIVLKYALKANVKFERAIEQSRDLIEKNFAKYKDRKNSKAQKTPNLPTKKSPDKVHPVI